MSRIYVATSWRNTIQPQVVTKLRSKGFDVYDFRNPPHGPGGFAWEQIDPDWEKWTGVQYREHLLSHPRAAQGYMADYRAMQWADIGLMVLPCGNSAHMEIGYFNGAGKRSIIYCPTSETKPDLMYLMADHICFSWVEVLEALR
jgi:hypothetical protein